MTSATRPPGFVFCSLCATLIGTAPTRPERGRVLDEHFDRVHLGRQTEVRQMPTVDWHTQALTAVRTLAETGRPFVISEVIRLGVPDAPNPRADWGRLAKEAQELGWITPTGGLGRSVRPSAKSSPVAEWVGTVKGRNVA